MSRLQDRSSERLKQEQFHSEFKSESKQERMKRIAYILALALLFNSCEKLLVVDPVTDIPAEEAIQTVQDLENLSNSMYNGLQGGSFMEETSALCRSIG